MSDVISGGARDEPIRRLPIGAEVQPGGDVHFRLWAPAADNVVVVIDPLPAQRMAAEPGGYFSVLIPEARAGMRYGFRLDGQERVLPDPASRFQPDGPHGSSQIVDPTLFAWTDGAWTGVIADRLVIYEMHIGTLTPEGTWVAATERLPALAELGITCIEMMPVAEFPGRFGWGYDGVDLFAPTRLYGEPDDLRRFVDRAHALRMAVILDVVYNHLGPDGNFLRAFAPAYFSQRHQTEWGETLNFDGSASGPVREFFVANSGYWVDEYHFDGLRLDATHRIYDDSPDHILAAIARQVRATRDRATFIAAENDAQVARLARPTEAGGYGLDALWNDDFHHAALVALTGRRQGYYRNYRGSAGEFVALAKHGFLFQGQDSTKRGTAALDLPATRFVTYLQNHDQIAHSRSGRRGHQLASPGCWRAMTAYLLLSPGIPLLFQGQEFSASSAFLYFADHSGELGRLVSKGRAEFLAQFASLALPSAQETLLDPGDVDTFRRCVLDAGERARNHETLALHRDLIALRRRIFRHGPPRLDATVLRAGAWAMRYFLTDGDILLIVNIGRDRVLDIVPEPLLTASGDHSWRCLWSSDDLRYGGDGTPEPVSDGIWRIPGHAAIVLAPASTSEGRS
jgi:maltooligosyltrehalose trehalohydrolase